MCQDDAVRAMWTTTSCGHVSAMLVDTSNFKPTVSSAHRARMTQGRVRHFFPQCWGATAQRALVSVKEIHCWLRMVLFCPSGVSEQMFTQWLS